MLRPRGLLALFRHLRVDSPAETAARFLGQLGVQGRRAVARRPAPHAQPGPPEAATSARGHTRAGGCCLCPGCQIPELAFIIC